MALRPRWGDSRGMSLMTLFKINAQSGVESGYRSHIEYMESKEKFKHRVFNIFHLFSFKSDEIRSITADE